MCEGSDIEMPMAVIRLREKGGENVMSLLLKAETETHWIACPTTWTENMIETLLFPKFSKVTFEKVERRNRKPVEEKVNPNDPYTSQQELSLLFLPAHEPEKASETTRSVPKPRLARKLRKPDGV